MSRKRTSRRHRKPPRIHRLSLPGAPPATLTVAANVPKPSIRVFKYNADQIFEESPQSVADLQQLIEPGYVTWIDIDGLGDETALHQVCAAFGLHGLAMEDVVNVHQRMKVDEYDDHLFIVLRMVKTNDHVDSEQLSMFLGKDFVFTLQQFPGDCLDPVRERLRMSRGRIRGMTADYLAYAIIDSVVDAYFPVVDQYAERLERLDEQIRLDQLGQLMEDLHDIRGSLMTLRRTLRPLRDSLNQLMPDLHGLVGSETQFHLRDCYDHTVQLIELLDSYREMCMNLREYYMTVMNQRMNEIMKVLTVVATIFIPLSFVAGVYGMNFNTQLPGNMPELNFRYGYVLVLALMGLIVFGQLVFIWRKGWLK